MKTYLTVTIFVNISIFCQVAYSQMDRSWYKTDEEIDRSLGVKSDRGSKAQHKSLESMLKRVSEMNTESDAQNFEYLGNVLRKISKPYIYQVRDRIEVYDITQSKILSIPGHAEYFADQWIEAFRTTKKPWLDNDFQSMNLLMMETMIHLPSPETIWVLGHILESEEHLWSRDEILAIYKEKSHLGHNSSTIPSPRSFAGYVFQNIGLRNYPDYPSHKWKTAPLPWWEQVKSGELAFSFKGQSVEYRFKPDGTWDTIPIINPPDDREKPVREPAINTSIKNFALPQKDDREISSSWWKYVTGVLFLLALGAWVWRKNRN